MSSKPPTAATEGDRATLATERKLFNWLAVLGLIYVLLVGVAVVSRGFRAAFGDDASSLFAFAENPFVGLVIGILATALVQSSSATTSIIVGLVAGGLPVNLAIPMIMGANIGTSVTSSIVSLAYVHDKEDFKRAFSAATVLDLFNLMAVGIFFVLELLFRPLERLATATAGTLIGGGDLSVNDYDFIGMMVRPARDMVRGFSGNFPEPWNAVFQIVVGVALILVSIRFMSKFLKALLVGRAKEILHLALGRGPLLGILAGTIITILFQSSSVTTSLMVPLAGAGIFGLSVIYPFTLGANIGTTFTSLLAATSVSGERALPSLEIALVHLYLNLFGVLIIYGLPFLRDLPVKGANWLGEVCSQRKWLALVYIVGVFFVLPLGLVGLSRLF